MKLKITTTFKDKYNGKLYESGKVYEFSEKRALELLNDERNFVTLIEKKDVKNTKDKKNRK